VNLRVNSSYDPKETILRITRRGCTCRVVQLGECTFAHDGNKSFQYERTVVYRKSSRSGRWSSEATRDLGAGSSPDATDSPLFLSSALSFPSLCSPRLIYSFLRRWLPFFPDFFFISCLFARFLLPQTTAAYLYAVFASRGTGRGCFRV